jgi:hypothetical protein
MWDLDLELQENGGSQPMFSSGNNKTNNNMHGF